MMFQQSAPVFEADPVWSAYNTNWDAPSDWRFLNSLRQFLIGDSELLQLSHYLPIVIRIVEGRPAVVASIDGAYSRARLVTASGRWIPPYVPIALRCLPFRLPDGALSPKSDTLLSLDLGLTGPTKKHPLKHNGKPSGRTLTVLRTMDLLRNGQLRLIHAAEQLVLMGLLAPLTEPDAHRYEIHDGDGYYSIDVGRFITLSNLRTFTAARYTYLSLELAAACIYSARHLRSAVRHPLDIPMSRADTAFSSHNLDDIIRDIRPIPFRLDEGAVVDVSVLLQKDK